MTSFLMGVSFECLNTPEVAGLEILNAIKREINHSLPPAEDMTHAFLTTENDQLIHSVQNDDGNFDCPAIHFF